jgi:predicted N-acetyltransferase YhbS
MNFTIRAETPADHPAITQLIKATYQNVSYSNHREQDMVERLRASPAFVPQLSLVAEAENGAFAGHVMLTKINIENAGVVYPALALAPLSVLPEYQKMGVGSKLVKESHCIAQTLGYNFIVILGIANYYQKFGYELSSKYKLVLPFKMKEEHAFVISLNNAGLEKITNGVVIYDDAFFG